jgi:hypothetical protein
MFNGPIHNAQLGDILRGSEEWVPLYTTPPAAPVQDIDWKDMYEKEKRRSEMWVAKYEKDIGPIEYAVPVAAPVQKPVAWGCNRYIEDDNGFQIETDEPELAWGKYAPDDNGWWPLYTTPPATQPAFVQEPVAWMHTMIDDVVIGHRPADLKIHPDRWMPLYKDPTPCQTCEALARTVMMDQTAHDTTPPAAQRQWVGLTNEEYAEAEKCVWAVVSLDDTEKEANREFARAIEAKLKEKNT